ncbi:hypothetical protein [uncultured Aquimarina sp.]|uniref:hypothetical protein n=1 Tax=uncultured Aquimarina sp. TaxID=575652 RepID=UPI002604D6FC|nr:hypothetical protein [uncultured Aquimarina sp.]
MNKSILKIGKSISKSEQKLINGGIGSPIGCRVYCPSYCKCSGPLNDLCEYITTGEHCSAL